MVVWQYGGSTWNYDVQCMYLDKYKVLSTVTRALVKHLRLSPPPVTPWVYHILEPGGLVLHPVPGAPVPKVGPGGLAFTGDTHLATPDKYFGLLVVLAVLHRLLHLEDHAVLVVVLLLFERLQVLPHVILLLLPHLGQLAVLARQEHGGLS